MSTGFKQLIQSLQSDFTLVAQFLDNPKHLVSRYRMTSAEKIALLTRDFDALAVMCGSRQLAAGVLSATHTPIYRYFSYDLTISGGLCFSV